MAVIIGKEGKTELLRKRTVIKESAKADDYEALVVAHNKTLLKFCREIAAEIKKLGFTVKPGNHPIVPIMLGDARLAQEMAAELLDEGIYVIGFFYPVVPKGEARIRVQISAAHTEADLRFALEKLAKVGRRLKCLK